MRTNKLLISTLGAGLLSGVMLAPTTALAHGDGDWGRDRQERVEHWRHKDHHHERRHDHGGHRHDRVVIHEYHHDRPHRYRRTPVVIYRDDPFSPPLYDNAIGVFFHGVWH